MHRISFDNEDGRAIRVGATQTAQQAVLPHDPITHPAHYTFGTIEVIEAIEDWRLDYHRGNAVKYIARAAHKGHALEDLKKAMWYLQRAIAALEATE